MRQSSIDAVIRDAHDGIHDDLDERQAAMSHFPVSVVVQCEFLEKDSADAWLNETLGQKDVTWKDLWYYKTDYNYGYCEYFFRDGRSADAFIGRIPSICAVYPNGETLRTDGAGIFVKVGNGAPTSHC